MHNSSSSVKYTDLCGVMLLTFGLQTAQHSSRSTDSVTLQAQSRGEVSTLQSGFLKTESEIFHIGMDVLVENTIAIFLYGSDA